MSLLRKTEIGGAFRIGLEPCAVGLVGGETIERDQPVGNVVGAFMRHPIAEEISTALRNDSKPMPRVFFEGITLKRIELVTDEDRDGHASLRRPRAAFYCVFREHASDMTELCKWWAIAAALAAAPTRIFGQVLGGRRRLGGQKMMAGLVWDLRRGLDADQARRKCDLIARRCWLVIDNVEHAHGAARESRIDRLRNVVDVDAIRDVAGLGDTMHGTAQEAHHSVASRTIDAAEPQDRDWQVASRPERLPIEFGLDAGATAARERQNGRRSLVDPRT